MSSWLLLHFCYQSKYNNLRRFSYQSSKTHLQDFHVFQVYPVGTGTSSTDYISLYYAVAMGDNDDELQWPFSNRFIRLSVVDQDTDTVARMSQSNNFVSNSDSSAWQKPTTVSASFNLLVSHFELKFYFFNTLLN